MMTLDFTFERRLELTKRDAMEQGRAEGLSQGRYEGRVEGLSQGRKEGRKEERNQGLEALITTLREFLATPEDILARVVQNPNYADVTLEQVKRYFS